MKAVNHIVIVSAAIALTMMEASAQSSSSATQTITFGVRRTPAIVLDQAAGSSSFALQPTSDLQGSVKMTVGSYSASKSIAYRTNGKPFRTVSFNAALTSQNLSSANRPSAEAQHDLPVASAGFVDLPTQQNLVVTLTE